MRVIKTPDALGRWVKEQREQGRTIGFVPTMGALHEGHLSLIRASRKSSACTVCSIFVNPTQFNDPKDLEKYPRDTTRDLRLLDEEGADVVFLPEVEDIYPKGVKAWVPIEFGHLDSILEGAFRPGHFQGVAQVVSRLLDIVRPDNLYMGQKDYQQVAIIRKMLETYPNPPNLQMVPTVRELHGLAMSSRNQRLSEVDWMRAGKLFEALVWLRASFREDIPLARALEEGRQLLDFPGFRLEYLTVCNRADLSVLYEWGHEGEMVALVACWLGEVRLIDNLPF